MAKIYCSNCGQLVNEDSNFCWHCGAAQHGRESAVYRAQVAPLTHPTEPSPEAAHLKDPNLAKLLQETVPRRHLAPAAKWLFFTNYIAITALILPLLAVGMYFEPFIAGGALLFYLLVLYLIATLAYNHFYFSIDNIQIKIDYGIIHKRHATVPFTQVQNVNIIRTLIDRMFGIAKLEVESAGSGAHKKRDFVGGTRSKAEAFLPGVTLKEAQHFHDLILQKAAHHYRG